MFSLLYNLYTYIRTKSERRACLAVLGVDNAGKTTLLNTVQGLLDKEVTPTFGFNSHNTNTKTLGLSGKQFTLQVFDLGGGQNIRRVWKSYLADVHAVVFVTDAADLPRFAECKAVLHQTLGNEFLHNKPILVFANKQDLPSAATAAEMAEQLGLSTLKQNPYMIMACTAKTPQGQKPDQRIWEGLSWIMKSIGDLYPQLNPRVEADSLAVKQEEAKKKLEREERVRKAKEERARQAAQDMAAVATSVQQHNVLLSPLPGGIESPRVGTIPAHHEHSGLGLSPLNVSSTVPLAGPHSPQMTNLSDLVAHNNGASLLHASMTSSITASSQFRNSHSGQGLLPPKPPQPDPIPSPELGLTSSVAAVGVRQSASLQRSYEPPPMKRSLAGDVMRTSNNSAILSQHETDLKSSFTSRQNKVMPVPIS